MQIRSAELAAPSPIGRQQDPSIDPISAVRTPPEDRGRQQDHDIRAVRKQSKSREASGPYGHAPHMVVVSAANTNTLPACSEPKRSDIGEPNKATRIVKRKSASVDSHSRIQELDVYRANPDTPQKDALRNEVEARDEKKMKF